MARVRRSDLKKAALAYAAEGWPVLACYTNTLEGCSCGDARCMSPGKHPYPKLSPNGVQSATTDLDEIASWPFSKINIGIALGHNNLMALDVDDAEVVAALLAPETVIQDETGAARTGRGIHLYFLVKSEKHKTEHLRDKVTRNKIGHIAGVGAYVIAPPSFAPGGKNYKWIGQKNGQWIPNLAETTDAYKYVQKVLKPLGFEPIRTAHKDIENIPDDIAVEEHDLGDIHKRLEKSSRLSRIRMRLRGKRGERERDVDKDLSGWEHGNACEIIREARDTFKVRFIPPEILAGILKKLDRVYYGKFESEVESGKRSRRDADKRYMVGAQRALSDEDMPLKPRKTHSKPSQPVETDKVEPDSERTIIGLEDEPTYWWDEDNQRLCFMTYYQKSAKAQKIGNFQVKLVREVMIDKGEKVPDRSWVVEFISALGEVVTITLKAEEIRSTYALENALTHKLPYTFVVAHNGYSHIKPAILELSTDVERGKVRAIPGWWTVGNADGDEERIFLLPSALGAITKDGLNPELRMQMEDLTDLEDDLAGKEYKPFGEGIRPPSGAAERRLAWKALRAAVECGPPEVTVPILLQVMMGPLWSAGADEVPSLLHVSGRTGVLKSSFCNVAMSLLGTFNKNTPPISSWPAISPSALRNTLNSAKDLTVLVDDYKEGVVYDKRGMRELIQAYADKAVRQRLKSSGEKRKSLEMQAVMLSNGEDRWDREASMVARTIFLDVQDFDFKDNLLRKAQNAVKRGELQLLGGHYLSWLCAQDELFEEREVAEIREKEHRKLLKRTTGRDMHRRLLASIATVAATGKIFLRFVGECYPKNYIEASRWVATALQVMASGTKERAKEVRQLAPLRMILGQIASEAEAGKATFFPLYGITGEATRQPNNSPRAETVGWWYKNKMFLNENTTFGWYNREMKKQGREVLFSWSAVKQEALNEQGATEKRVRVGKNKRQVRMIEMPLALLNLEENS